MTFVAFRLRGTICAATLVAIALLSTTVYAQTRDVQAVEVGAASVVSPDGRLKIAVAATAGAPTYHVTFNGHEIIVDSPLGLTFADEGGAPPMNVIDVTRSTRDETYELPVGKTRRARDHHSEVVVTFGERGSQRRMLQVIARAYDDGVAFRYRIPEQPGMERFALTGELTGFAMPADADAWVLPLPKLNDHYEYYYDEKKLGAIDAKQLVGTPLLTRRSDGTWVAIADASLTDYAGMGLMPDSRRPGKLTATLAPLPHEPDIKVRGSVPFVTPWRVIMVADSPGKLIESNLITNLNEPCAIADTSWIKPGKVSFLWWNGYVVGRDANGNPIQGGVDTETCIKYVDFAADNGIAYASLDGLDVAWYGGPLQYRDQDLTTGHAPRLDVQSLLAHAKKRGVGIRLWMDSKALKPQLDKALDAFRRWGVEGIMVDFVEQENQESVRWCAEVVRKAADHKLTVSFHNAPKPTGLSRTWPNLLTVEAVRNQEWNKFPHWGSKGSTPRHELIVPFTRMLAGPLDFHSGGFRSVLPKDYVPHDIAPLVMGTRCHQVAMYTVYENPLPMVVDSPDAYLGQPGFEMLRDVPTTWDETRVLAGQPGEFVTIARRSGATWYVGSMAGDGACELTIPLTFLGEGNFTLDGWRDGPADQPNAAAAETPRTVTAFDLLTVKMSPAGGHIVRLKPAPR